MRNQKKTYIALSVIMASICVAMIMLNKNPIVIAAAAFFCGTYVEHFRKLADRGEE